MRLSRWLILGFLLAMASVGQAEMPEYQVRCSHPSHGPKGWANQRSVDPDNLCRVLADHRQRFAKHEPFVVEYGCVGDNYEQIPWKCP